MKTLSYDFSFILFIEIQMGLDMYLSGKVYVGGNYEHRNVKWVVDITQDWKKIPIDLKKITYVEENVAYRRKANQIHRRFVENVQDWDDDCRDHYVSVEQLKQLVERCKKVLESLEKQTLVEKEIDDRRNEWKKVKVMVYPNIDLAMELLPPVEWFFFGDYNIDEYYVENLKSTIEQLSWLDDMKDYYYCSSR